MNGRALSEKAIEVSPSSSRVLDRAAEILTPFPPSKNRPRPGDWTCPSCGFSNFQRRTACFRCSYPASSAMPSADPMGYSSYGYGPPHMMPHHQIGHQGGHGVGHGRAGGGGGMVPFRAGDWKCGSEGCGYHNFAKNVTCLRCGASRAGAAVVADSAFPSPHEHSSGYGMTPTSITGTPGPGPFAATGGFGSGFGSQQYGGPPSQYALPSGMGAPPNAYPPIGAGYGQGVSGGPFDNRAAEAAFSSAANGPSSTSASSGPSAYGGGPYGGGNSMGGANPDPFAFLSSGLGGLSVNDENRRNGPNSTKSPA